MEELDGDGAAAWVRDRNAETARRWPPATGSTRCAARLREVLDADRRIPFPGWRGDGFYNFWQDAAHPRGAVAADHAGGVPAAEPDWEVLLDVDALADAEGENWVWQGAAGARGRPPSAA